LHYLSFNTLDPEYDMNVIACGVVPSIACFVRSGARNLHICCDCVASLRGNA